MIWEVVFLFVLEWLLSKKNTCSSVNSPQPYSFPEANKKLIQEHENVKEQKIIESLFYVAVRVFEITKMFCGNTHFSPFNPSAMCQHR